MMNRREAREKAMQCLYQMDLSKISVQEALENMEIEDPDPYLFSLVTEIEKNLAQIDQQINAKLKGWKFNRLSFVDKAILRLGVYELMYKEDIPDLVAINEAVELGKRFGDTESSKFINGVLSKIMKEKTNTV